MLNRPSYALITLIAAALAASPALAGGGDWVTFTDETATRLVADTGVGLTDPEEKDYAIGDVDRDGDTDVLVAPQGSLHQRRAAAECTPHEREWGC